MRFSIKGAVAVSLFSFLVCAVAALGVVTGLLLGQNANVVNKEDFGVDSLALPSLILDANGDLITQFFAGEKREIVPVSEVPSNLIQTILVREDDAFFTHNGFSLWGTLRAAFFIFTGGYFSGGSTLTQQLAGTMYADRREITITRKLKELWWAWQLERQLTKYEILELYMNKMFFGHNTYGVQAASHFYFGHTSQENNVAESAILAIQLANPSGRYSPVRNPGRARKIQHLILERLVDEGFISKEEADLSFQSYWRSYDWSRAATTTAFFERKDKAPYFSEYIRKELETLLEGRRGMYEGGYRVHTSLDLSIQEVARRRVNEGLATADANHRQTEKENSALADSGLLSLLDLLSLSFGIEHLSNLRNARAKQRAVNHFYGEISDTLDVLAALFPVSELYSLTEAANKKKLSRGGDKPDPIQVAMVTLDNSTGHIVSMIGGSQFNRVNQFNRVMQASLMPGSTFKPLIYYTALASRKMTPSTLLYDVPSSFRNPDGTLYSPSNFLGRWVGPVLLRDALANSLNIPSIQVLETVGFQDAIAGAAKILQISDPQEIEKTFPLRYPLALGVISVAPIQIAKAYATFANQGIAVNPIAIRYVENSEGRIILNPEKELRHRQTRSPNRIMSPQVAYLMTSILSSSVKYGTLSVARWRVGGLGKMPFAGKTGTTQNNQDAWTVGFSPYYTTVIWMGYDKGVRSHGWLTGATLAGPVWARFMREIHANLPVKPFPKPATGLITVPISGKTGLLARGGQGESVRQEIFLEGTQPTVFSSPRFSQEKSRRQEVIRSKILASSLEAPASGLDSESSPNSGDAGEDPSLDLLADIGELSVEFSSKELKKKTLDPALID